MFFKINDKAFTLLELLLALAIFAIVVTAIYGTYLSQQKAYIVQDQIAGIQQNLRAAMFVMSREIRMAGFSGTVEKPSNLGIIEFGDEDKFDNDEINGKNDPGERNIGIALAYMREPDSIDNDGNGVIDDEDNARITVGYSLYNKNDGVYDIGRLLNGGIRQMIAQNIERMRFVFRDQNNTPVTNPGSKNNIRSVRITLVGRADRQDFDYTHTGSYDLDGSDGTDSYTPTGDHYRRRMLSTVVNCRNLGL